MLPNLRTTVFFLLPLCGAAVYTHTAATAALDLQRARHDLDAARTQLAQARGQLAALQSPPAVPEADACSPGVLQLAHSVDFPAITPGVDYACSADETVCTLRRSALEPFLREPALAARQARVVPALEQGRPCGFKVYGIRRGSLLRALGLRNGDLLRAVNRIPLRDAQSAMAAYRALQAPEIVTVDYTRRGEPGQLQVRLVD